MKKIWGVMTIALVIAGNTSLWGSDDLFSHAQALESNEDQSLAVEAYFNIATQDPKNDIQLSLQDRKKALKRISWIGLKHKYKVAQGLLWIVNNLPIKEGEKIDLLKHFSQLTPEDQYHTQEDYYYEYKAVNILYSIAIDDEVNQRYRIKALEALATFGQNYEYERGRAQDSIVKKIGLDTLVALDSDSDYESSDGED